ncbi:ATP-dependent Clp protease proteolytic subunit-like [Mytilus edulis]|uniref:ATP-dependent Clp protease proteolytic subunit n=1 Tax=Mytilus edulis TaxID=6550 RepID=A0A8S3RL98_MYTED|nr:CLPP [Mytilus edulis]
MMLLRHCERLFKHGHCIKRLLHKSPCRPYTIVVPSVIGGKSTDRERVMDIFSRLLLERIICINGQIDDQMSSIVIAQLLYLQSESWRDPINLYINSPGGVVTAGLAIYDTMQYIDTPISTWCIGQACSAASLLLTAGTEGMRRALPNSRIMIHQPSGSAGGSVTDIQIKAEEMLKMKRQVNDLYVRHTKRPLSEIENLLERDKYMSPIEAKEFGLIDEVIEKPPAEKSSNS